MNKIGSKTQKSGPGEKIKESLWGVLLSNICHQHINYNQTNRKNCYFCTTRAYIHSVKNRSKKSKKAKKLLLHFVQKSLNFKKMKTIFAKFLKLGSKTFFFAFKKNLQNFLFSLFLKWSMVHLGFSISHKNSRRIGLLKNYTDVTINAYIGLLLCSTYIHITCNYIL